MNETQPIFGLKNETATVEDKEVQKDLKDEIKQKVDEIEEAVQPVVEEKSNDEQVKTVADALLK